MTTNLLMKIILLDENSSAQANYFKFNLRSPIPKAWNIVPLMGENHHT
jgi:hypothetical protein